MNVPNTTGASAVPTGQRYASVQELMDGEQISEAVQEIATLLRENEELREKCAVLQSQVDNADVNLEQVRMALKSNHEAELTQLRERVKELEADVKRLDELMWRNDIMVKVFRGGILVVLKPYGTPSFPLRAAIDAALKGDAK